MEGERGIFGVKISFEQTTNNISSVIVGLPSKTKINSKINLKLNEKLISNPLDIANHFNETFSKMADNLVDKLPTPKNRYSNETTAKYYESHRLEENNFSFLRKSNSEIYKFLLLE